MTDLERMATIEEDAGEAENKLDDAFMAAYRKAAAEGKAFNLEALDVKEKPVFILAGLEDVLIFRQWGYEAVAINGTENALDVQNAVRKAAKTLRGLIVSLPPEYEEAKENLRGIIEKRAIDGYITPEVIDPATDPDGIQKAISALYGDFSRYCVANTQDDFLNEVQITNAKPPVSTGFKNLDKALAGGRTEGGLFPNLYTVGGGPGTGKTAFVMQIADYIAAHGRTVFVYALEMAANELKARSISRLTAEMVKNPQKEAATALEILFPEGPVYDDKERGATARSWSDGKFSTILAASQKYFEQAKNLYIFESVGGITARQIKKDVGNFVASHAEEEPPVVIVDYLQILAPDDPRATDKQNADKAIITLKDIVRTYHTPVISIISWNRSSYETEGELSAGKESGGLEYTAGTVISLQYESIINALQEREGKQAKDKASLMRSAKEALAKDEYQRPRIVASVKKARFAKNEIQAIYTFEKPFSRYIELRDKTE